MLTDTACRKATAGEKDRKLSDSGGLYLLIRKTGTKVFCWKYRHEGREKTYTIGRYPATSLKEARESRDQARKLLEQGIDPSTEKQQRKAKVRLEAANSFEAIARQWYQIKAETLTKRYAKQLLDRLEADVFPRVGKHPIREITPPMVLEVIRAIEKRDALEMAHRVRIHMSAVFVWAIAAGLAEYDPAATIRKALKPTSGKLRPALLKLPEIRKILPAGEKLADSYWATKLASRLLALTAARPGIVRVAERSEFEDLDGEQPVWRVPAEKMKLTRERKRDATFEFVMPLAPQTVEVVKTAMAVSPSDRWLFPKISAWRNPISDSTLSKHYRLAGFTGLHVPHGWRSSFSTVMNELAATEGREGDREIIDLMLAHVAEGVEPIYNRAAYMPRRREIARTWANLLMEGMAPAETLVPERLLR